MTSIGLIGCGNWGKNLGRALSDMDRLAAVADPAPAGKAFAAAAGVDWNPDFRAILADRHIGAVVIATPAGTHVDVATQALRAGKHVFVEKPIALDVKGAESLAELALEFRKTLMVGHLMQYHPGFRKLAQMVKDGELGPLQLISSDRMGFGIIRTEENVLWSFAPHDISMVLELAGEEPTSVKADGYAILQPRVHDATAVRLEFPSGLKATIGSSWLHPRKERRLIAVGERATVVFDDMQPWANKLTKHDNVVLWEGARPRAMAGSSQAIPVPEGEPLRHEMQHFIDSIEGGSAPKSDAGEAIRVLRVLEAAQLELNHDI